MRPGFAGIVLAAGLSRRMGRVDKLLVEVDGTPMVRRVVDVAVRAGLAPVVVVVGAGSVGVRAVLAGLPVVFAENGRPEDGLASSLRTGIEALRASARSAAEAAEVVGAAILLGDMPWVAPEAVRALVAAFDLASGHDVCVPVHAGRRGNPVLWGRRYFDELVALSGDRGARSLLDRHAGRVREVALDGEGVLLDVDTPSELEALRPLP